MSTTRFASIPLHSNVEIFDGPRNKHGKVYGYYEYTIGVTGVVIKKFDAPWGAPQVTVYSKASGLTHTVNAADVRPIGTEPSINTVNINAPEARLGTDTNMAINIFDVDTEAAPRQTYDVVGRFRAGHMIGKRPQTLSEWRVTTDDPEVADKIAALYGGKAQTWDNERQPHEVFTTATTIPVIVEKIFSSMTLWGRAGAIRKCDGNTLTYPEDQAGKACECASYGSLADRKAAAERGTGCSPDITVRFKLADAPDLGTFEFKTGSWSLARDIGKVEADLAAFGGRAAGTLSLVPVEFTAKDSGLLRKFTKSVVSLTAAAQSDAA